MALLKLFPGLLFIMVVIIIVNDFLKSQKQIKILRASNKSKELNVFLMKRFAKYAVVFIIYIILFLTYFYVENKVIGNIDQ
jgi:membrane-bound metal-dependent hydrolase YbcI (DUF457 family)